MTSRDLSRTDKPLATINNLMSADHVPVYRRPRKTSLKKKSMPPEVKLHLYDFETGENDVQGKKFKKSQKVRKRARIFVRNNKENSLLKPLKIVANNILGKSTQHENECNRIVSKKIGPTKHVLREIQADVHHNGYEDDILSITSEQCNALSDVDEEGFCGFTDEECNVLSDDEKGFCGFTDEECNRMDVNRDFIIAYGSKSPAKVAQPKTPNPYFTPIRDACMTPDYFKTPVKVAPRGSYIPIIDFNESSRGNQLQPNDSTENINPNTTFTNVSSGGANRFFSTPVKQNSFNYSVLSDLSANSLNATNCFGFDEPDDLNEEFLMSPIKVNNRKAVAVNNPLPTRTPLPSVQEVIKCLKEGISNEPSTKVATLFTPEFECSTLRTNRIDSYLNGSRMDFISQELSLEIDGAEPKLGTTIVGENAQRKPARRSYERPLYLRQRNNKYHEISDHEDEEKEYEELLTKNKKPIKKYKKKNVPTKKEKAALEKWASAFNSQCAQVDAFSLCIE